MFLDQQTDVAIWYTEYEGRDESIRYANAAFSDTFGIPIEDSGVDSSEIVSKIKRLEKDGYQFDDADGTFQIMVDNL